MSCKFILCSMNRKVDLCVIKIQLYIFCDVIIWGVTLKFVHFPIVVAFVNFLITVIVATAVVAKPQVYYREYKEMGCPEFNQHETVHLPHPFSCNKYLTCLSKSVLLQSCPGNLHWSIEKNMCDYADEKCVDDNTVYYNRISRRSRF